MIWQPNIMSKSVRYYFLLCFRIQNILKKNTDKQLIKNRFFNNNKRQKYFFVNKCRNKMEVLIQSTSDSVVNSDLLDKGTEMKCDVRNNIFILKSV